jgi:hypothetical protein
MRTSGQAQQEANMLGLLEAKESPASGMTSTGDSTMLRNRQE